VGVPDSAPGVADCRRTLKYGVRFNARWLISAVRLKTVTARLSCPGRRRLAAVKWLRQAVEVSEIEPMREYADGDCRRCDRRRLLPGCRIGI